MKKLLFTMAVSLMMGLMAMAQPPQGQRGQGGQRGQRPQLTAEQKEAAIQKRVDEINEDCQLDAGQQEKVKELYTKHFDVLNAGKPSLPSTGNNRIGQQGIGNAAAGGGGGGGDMMGGGGGGGAMMGGGGGRGMMGGGGNSEMLERIREQIKNYNDAKKDFDNGLKEMMTKDQFKKYQKGDKEREKVREKERASQRPAGGFPGGQRPTGN